MKRLGQLAALIGWPAQELAQLPANEVAELFAVSEAYEDWLAERINSSGQNHAGT